MIFSLSKSIDPNRIFITRKSNVSIRWDPFYSQPELVTLEEKVRKATSKRLRDFVLNIAGGATPAINESDKHYTENSDGVPFIRVQNLSPTGKLDLEDYKRITRSTHEGLLARSRLTGGELLVKITGVGRMAIASVVPLGFEGNINQHIVAIRTGDIKISETLAAYLNLDIAEKLASRRSTGGTRPALDYPALLSMPIIFDERIPKLIKAAVDKYEEKRAKAKAMIEQINGMILDELGIKMKPELQNTLESRIFRRSTAEVTGGRIDPGFYRPLYRIRLAELFEGRYPVFQLRELNGRIFQGVGRNLGKGGTIRLLKVKNITSDGKIDFSDTELVTHVPTFKVLIQGDIISPFIGEAIRQHKFAYFYDNIQNPYTVDNNTGVIRLNDNRLTSKYFLALSRTKLIHWQLDQLTGGGGVPFLGAENARLIRIPLPPDDVQRRVVKIANELEQQASTLNLQANKLLEKAKAKLEKLLLGNGGVV